MSGDSSDDDVPLATRKSQPAAPAPPAAEQAADPPAPEQAGDSSSDDDAPLAARKTVKQGGMPPLHPRHTCAAAAYARLLSLSFLFRAVVNKEGWRACHEGCERGANRQASFAARPATCLCSHRIEALGLAVGGSCLTPARLSSLQEPAAAGRKKPAAGGKKAAAPAGKADGKAAAAKAAGKPRTMAEVASQSSSKTVAVKREKKVYDIPGQTRDTPAEVGRTRSRMRCT